MDRIDARSFLTSLKRKSIETLTGRPNSVLEVAGDIVVVATDKSPRGKPVPIEWVQDALDRLVREREIVISVESVGYRSAFIGAVLTQVPGAAAGQGKVRMLD